MELFQQILCQVFSQEKIQIVFPELATDHVQQLVEAECYKALRRIREILDDDSLEDRECFEKIEEIVRVFESIGSDGGSRHDFG